MSGYPAGASSGGPAQAGPEQAVWDQASRFLNSDWAFGLTLVAARRRRLILTVLGAVIWAFMAYSVHPPAWDPEVSGRFLSYPFRALFKPWVLTIIFILSAFFNFSLFIARRYLPGASSRSIRQINLATAVVFGILWAVLARQATEPDFDPAFVTEFLSYPFEALFAAHVFRHVLIAALAFWLAYRIAAVYLDDIFELEDLPVAERFILQAAFASQYNTINIRDGDVAAKDRESPIVRIGGPGYVRVYLENAALFERPDGSSRVIGPTVETRSGVEVLSGFERLRAVVNLLEQSEELSLEERTLDGIRVRAEDVNFRFSVYRGGQHSTLTRPYPFTEEGIKRLVYMHGNMPLPAVMSGMIRGELARFISRHTLNEFLASISMPELDIPQEEELELEGGSPPAGATSPLYLGAEVQPPPAFVPRSQILTDLLAPEFSERAADRGLELIWVGAGAFETPSEIVPERHLDAWLLSRENLARSSSLELDRLRRESMIAELIRLVQEVPIRTFRRLAGEPPQDVLHGLLTAYHGKLVEALNILERQGQASEEREALERALVFLTTHFIGRYLE